MGGNHSLIAFDEKICRGFIARTLARLRWEAVTVPWGKDRARIFYWTDAGLASRDHEISLHVPQIEKMGAVKYLVVWVSVFALLSVLCLGDLHRAHELHPMEWEK